MSGFYRPTLNSDLDGPKITDDSVFMVVKGILNLFWGKYCIISLTDPVLGFNEPYPS